MRTIDENKKIAIYEATIKLVNEVGFSSASVAKIAKEANVSPATLYVYHESKEDLLCAIYIELKTRMRDSAFSKTNQLNSTKEKLKSIWEETISFISNHQDYFQFVEAFSNSHYQQLLDIEIIKEKMKPFFQLLEEGKERNELKNVHNDVLSVFAFHPVWILCNPRKCQLQGEMTLQRDLIFEMAWDAIKK